MKLANHIWDKYMNNTRTCRFLVDRNFGYRKLRSTQMRTTIWSRKQWNREDHTVEALWRRVRKVNTEVE